MMLYAKTTVDREPVLNGSGEIIYALPGGGQATLRQLKSAK